MKKVIILMLLILLIVGCESSKEQKDSKKIVTVTTTFIGDMVENLVGNKVDLKLIIPAGNDPHMYEAKPEDLDKLKNTNLVLYHGLHFEGKMNNFLEKVGKEITKGFVDSEITRNEENGNSEIDPHFWFNIKLYKKATENVAKYLIELMPSEEENIKKSLNDYLLRLDDLDKYNKEKLSELPKNARYLITPHDAFNYLSNYYNIKVVAPQGISTGSEVSNADIEETANFIVENKIKSIFAESTTNPDRMRKIQEVVKSKGFDVKVVSGEGRELFSDSLAVKGEKGDTFIEMYKHNIDLIVNNLK